MGRSTLLTAAERHETLNMNATKVPNTHGVAIDDNLAVRILDEDECWKLLSKSEVGRFAVRTSAGVDVFPVNYLTHERALYFRSAPGSKLVDLTREPSVAFEVDGEHGRHIWSVVAHGTAHRLGTDSEIHESGIASLHTSYPSNKFNYVRIIPMTISGRSFAKPLAA
jgi:uncharacterized protein